MDKLPKKLPAGSEIEVSFEYNLNGIVEISAIERKSGRKEKMKIDVNRLERKDDIPGEPVIHAEPKKEKTDKKKKIERIIKTAKKKLNIIDDPELLEKIKAVVDSLEKTQPGDGKNMEKKAEELAGLVAEI